jgi:hypothetical protein
MIGAITSAATGSAHHELNNAFTSKQATKLGDLMRAAVAFKKSLRFGKDLLRLIQ